MSKGTEGVQKQVEPAEISGAMKSLPRTTTTVHTEVNSTPASLLCFKKEKKEPMPAKEAIGKRATKGERDDYTQRPYGQLILNLHGQKPLQESKPEGQDFIILVIRSSNNVHHPLFPCRKCGLWAD